MKKNTIRTIIQEFLLCEAAQSVNNAAGTGASLLILPFQGNGNRFILFNAEYYLDLIYSLKDKGVKLTEALLQSVFSSEFGILGIVATSRTLEPCNSSVNIKASAANKGYGPLLYDIAMSHSANNSLMPDRDSVSDAADKVWKYYFNNRPDIEKKKLDNIDNPQTPPQSDDCRIYNKEEKPELDYSYEIKHDVNVAPLIKNYEKLIEDLKDVIEMSKYINFDKILKRSLSNAAMDFFQSRYNS